MKINEAFNFQLDQDGALSDLTEGAISDVSQLNNLESAFLQRGDDVIVMAGMKGGRYEWVRFEDGIRRERGEYPNRGSADTAIKQLEYDGYVVIKRDGILMKLLKGLGNVVGLVGYLGGVVGVAVGVAAVIAGIAGAGTLGLGLLGMTVGASVAMGGWWLMEVEPNVAATTRDMSGPATNPETIANQKARRQAARDSVEMRKQTRLLRKMA